MMYKMKIFALLASIFMNLAKGENNDVVVLVHGIASDASTWGYITELQQSGLRVIAVTVNPFESNYDRAVDLYAQLKGTQMDYGICHSTEAGHFRFGRDYTGKALYPEWDENNRIHFVGHSMGGITIRYLEMFLEVGNGCSQDTHELFTGRNRDWITSITAIASPMDGATFLNQIPFGADDLFLNLFARFSSSIDQLAFPQWGLIPEPGERKGTYINRVQDSGLFEERDFSAFDLSVGGAKLFNDENLQVYRSDRYYLSYAAERTSPTEDCTLFFFNCVGVEEGDFGMSLLLKVSADIIGESEDPADRPNDGIVNQVRARCPGNTNCKDVPDQTEIDWTPGQWHTVSLGYLDHFQITERDDRNDRKRFEESAQRLYLELGVRLKQLGVSSTRLTTEEEFETSEMAADTLRHLKAIDFLTTPIETEEKGMSETGAVFLMLFTVLSVIGIAIFAVKKRKSMKNNNTSSVDATPTQATL